MEQRIDFAIRFPHSHLIHLRNGESYTAEELLENQSERYFNKVILDGVRLNVALHRLEEDFLLVAGTFLPKKLFSQYRYRWSIETFFQSVKKRGFRLEETHLKDLTTQKANGHCRSCLCLLLAGGSPSPPAYQEYSLEKARI